MFYTNRDRSRLTPLICNSNSPGFNTNSLIGHELWSPHIHITQLKLIQARAVNSPLVVDIPFGTKQQVLKFHKLLSYFLSDKQARSQDFGLGGALPQTPKNFSPAAGFSHRPMI